MTTEPTTAPTGWHYGPTATDPEPGKMWHYGCGQEVLCIDDGAVCGCGASWDENGEPEDTDPTPSPLCTWPACLTPEQQAELADQVTASMLGEPTTPGPDQRPICGCREEPRDNPAPECQSPQGCHRVVPCDPGCAVTGRCLADQLAAANARAHNLRIVIGTPAPDGAGQAAAGSGWSDETVAALGCTREEAEAFWREYHAPHITTAPDPAPAFTWAEAVASHGIGPTATVDIDVHAPGHDEPVPVEIPLAKARELYAHLGGVLAEHEATPRTARLRERLERAHAEAFKLARQITDLRCELTDERTRAEQAEDLLRIAHETSNRSEAERALAVRRAQWAEAVVARIRAWIAGEPVTAVSSFGEGYREALRDITDLLATNPPAGGQETGAGQAGGATA